MSTAIEFNNISKQYRLGLVSTRTLSNDLNRWWVTTILRKEDPYLKIGETNDRSQKGESEYVWALKNIDFKVEQGDVIGIIGKNGAGKSTLLKLLSKVTGPTTGTIKARGRIGSLLEVGTGFHPEMTGRENIFMNGAILGMNKKEIASKLDEIVDFSGCERYIDTPVKRYSSGMMVRLGFAVAAHLDPEILVVDEVLAVGDAEFQKKAIGKMQDVSRGEGRTVLFVSHNMDSILNLCNNGVLLENGQTKFSGNIQDTVDKYLMAGASSFKFENKECSSGLCVKTLKFVGNDRQTRGTYMFDESIKLHAELERKTSYEIQRSTILSITMLQRNKKICTVEQPLVGMNDSNNAIFDCELPASLFAPGTYYFEICIHIPNVEFIQLVNEAITVTISDTGTELLKYNGVDSGVVIINPSTQFRVG